VVATCFYIGIFFQPNKLVENSQAYRYSINIEDYNKWTCKPFYLCTTKYTAQKSSYKVWSQQVIKDGGVRSSESLLDRKAWMQIHNQGIAKDKNLPRPLEKWKDTHLCLQTHTLDVENWR
jgi:hypothetical protein